ncbi:MULTISPECIES: hypothetical protein [unclassified Streptomyces]|uniref:hypothetical protein n=1 Tax=unclassified Streptomyces TaxID=2593676 RepID=UPI002E809FBA|nr:hypothetical protein [Streptomyces sp. NBC_00566]WUB87190.1 hypothetical protein OG812_11585 [Streptomyces sp. NBC_00566]
MRHCNRAGRPPRDELIRHLRDAGEDPADLPPHELTRATCELEARHEGPHADHLGEIGRAEQLWVRWDGDRYTFVRLGPCEAPAGDGDVCRLFAGHDPGHSWEMRDLLHG